MYQLKTLPISQLLPNDGQIAGLPKNPRFIRDKQFEKLVRSVQDDPEMLQLRECLVFPFGKKYVIIAGNMRYRACKELGTDDIPCKILPKSTPIEKLKAYTVKDNVSFGDWSTEDLANEWSQPELADWGVKVASWNTESGNSDTENEESRADGEGAGEFSPGTRTSDEPFSVYEQLMSQANKRELLEVLNDIKEQYGLEKLEDALMHLVGLYRAKNADK